LLESAARRLLSTPYCTLGRWLGALDANALQRLRDLRRAAVTFAQPTDRRTYATLVEVLALGEGLALDGPAELAACTQRLTDAITVATLSRLGYASVVWSGLSIEPGCPIPWTLTEAGRRHVRLHPPPA
ncbi:MAG TPA: hypothetical protein PKC20_20380, partial [Burkholderiaceae bacterium]|nr:hypothetical protein [Burkholderiaceae bacterium]